MENDDQYLNKLAKRINAIKPSIRLEEIDLEGSQRWFDEGKEHCETFTLLLKNKKYPQAVEQLQLAVEKLCKSYGFLFNAVDDDIARDVGHISPRVFARIFERMNIVKFCLIVQEIHKRGPELQIASKVDTFIKDVKKQPSKTSMETIARLPADEISTMINFVINAPAEFEKSLKNLKFSDMLDHMNLKYANAVKKHLQKENTWDELKDLPAKDFFVADYLYMKLVVLSIITFAHYNSSRYPLNAFSKPIEYNEKLGIVACLDKLDEMLRGCIDGFVLEFEEMKTAKLENKEEKRELLE